MDLKDKHVIVTGGVKGIGNSIVNGFIKEGATVGIFDIDKEGFDNLKINNLENIHFIECNITDYRQVEDSVNKFYNEFEKIDVLVNNAGILYSAPLVSLAGGKFKKHDIEMWHKVLSIDLTSVFYMTLSVVEKMIMKRTKGVIVNISSVAAAGNAGQSAYSAAKAGVNALTKTWAKELGLWGIRVVGIAPGYCGTESTHKVMGQEVLKEVKGEIPLRRLGSPEEIAAGVISVVKNDYIHGKILEIDGGLSI